jgi:hypothetical protein
MAVTVFSGCLSTACSSFLLVGVEPGVGGGGSGRGTLLGPEASAVRRVALAGFCSVVGWGLVWPSGTGPPCVVGLLGWVWIL